MNVQIGWVVQLSLVVMFAVSTASKLGDPMSFVRGVREYRILPQRSALVFAILLIVCEAFVSLSHLGGWLLAFAAPMGLTMLCIFFVAVSVNLVRTEPLLPLLWKRAGGDDFVTITGSVGHRDLR